MSTAPANAISVEQNSERQILRLAAFSAVYTRAKRVLALQATLTIVGGFAWPILMEKRPDWKVWAAFYSFAIALLDALVLQRVQSELRKRGAKIQELFDCELLRFPWRSLVAGDPPDPELISEEGRKYIQGTDLSHLRDWYPAAVSRVPLPLARLICQRSSAWWDTSIRRRYSIWIYIVLVLIIVIAIALAIHKGMSVENFVLAFLAPVTPAVLWGAREIQDQKSAMDALEKLKRYIEQKWTEALRGALTGEELQESSIEIQNEIFHLRSRNPLIFNWVNKLLRGRQQRTMNEAADELVRQALESTAELNG